MYSPSHSCTMIKKHYLTMEIKCRLLIIRILLQLQFCKQFKDCIDTHILTTRVVSMLFQISVFNSSSIKTHTHKYLESFRHCILIHWLVLVSVVHYFVLLCSTISHKYYQLWGTRPDAAKIIFYIWRIMYGHFHLAHWKSICSAYKLMFPQYAVNCLEHSPTLCCVVSCSPLDSMYNK